MRLERLDQSQRLYVMDGGNKFTHTLFFSFCLRLTTDLFFYNLQEGSK